jgi:DNA-binding beta-propeller fold protein YncE
MFRSRGLVRDLTSSHNRAAGPLLLCALALALNVSVGQGLPMAVPDTILLPDSLGPLRPGYHLAFGSSTDNIYVASESSDIIVVDGNTFQRIKRIYTGTPVGAALLVAEHNKLYCAYPSQGRIGIIDCATNDTVGTIQVSTRPRVLCYSSGSDKLYCCDSVNQRVTVIDCTADTVCKVISTGYGPTAAVYDPTTDKVYAATSEAVLAISCPADSVVATISAVKKGLCMCVNTRRQKLYVVVPPYDIFVVSTPIDSAVARMGYGIVEPVLACDEATDRLYCPDNDGDMLEFDCIQDTLTRFVYVGDFDASVGLFCDSWRNHLYYLYQDYGAGYLLELDCATLNGVSEFCVGRYPVNLHADPLRYRLMCLGWSSEASVLPVFDYKSDTTCARGAVPLCGWTYTMCHNPATSRLYYWWGIGITGMGVIDEQTNRVVAQTFLSQVNMNQSAYSRTSNKYYVRAANKGQEGLGVIDGSRDSLVRFIEMGSECSNPCWCPDENKVYCYVNASARLYIAVIDCYTDSVERELDIYGYLEGFEYLGRHRMLCARPKGFVLIDTQTDSILVDTATEMAFSFEAAHTGDGEKVYVLRKSLIGSGPCEVLSSSSLSPLATIAWPYGQHCGGGFLVYSDTTKKLYWFVDDSVLAIDATSDTVTACMATSVQYGDACLDHTGRYLFCSSPYDSSLRIYDTQADSLVAIYQHLPYPEAVVSSQEQCRVYVACPDVILSYPDAPPGVEEGRPQAPTCKPQASVVRSVLYMPRDMTETAEVSDRVPRPALLDVSGREVMVLNPGPNDISRLAPGVYFVREEGRGAGGVGRTRKVVIAR